MGLSPSDQIPGRAIPFWIKYQDGVILLKSCRNKIPGWGYALQIKYQGRLSPADQILGRCYHLETKYQDGVTLQIKYQGRGTPFRSNTRTALSFRNKIPEWGYPHLDRIPGHCYPSEAKYRDGMTPLQN